MTTIDQAIDDYLHTIVRTRPWIKKREQELLEALSEWLYEQPESRVGLSQIGPALVQQYAAAMSLSAADQHELLDALDHLYSWGVHSQMVAKNPFAAASV